MNALLILATTAFCRIATPTSVEFAPNFFSPNPGAPTEAEYLARGWFRNEIAAATNRVGYTARLDHYEARGTAVYAVYEYVAIPWTPRRFYKYDISAACLEEGFLDGLMAFISADARVKWFWDAAEICVENDPYFVAATNAVVTSGEVSEARLRRILDRAYALGTNSVSEVTK